MQIMTQFCYILESLSFLTVKAICNFAVMKVSLESQMIVCSSIQSSEIKTPWPLLLLLLLAINH